MKGQILLFENVTGWMQTLKVSEDQEQIIFVCVCVCISSAMPYLAQNRCPDDVHQITLEKQVLSCSVN